jgi:hypothetical protein
MTSVPEIVHVGKVPVTILPHGGVTFIDRHGHRIISHHPDIKRLFEAATEGSAEEVALRVVQGWEAPTNLVKTNR